MLRTIALALVIAAPAAAHAQSAFETSLEVVPEPPGEPDDAELSDDALIRWASNEVRIYEGRPRNLPRAPIAPDAYLLTGTGTEAIPRQLEEDLVRVLAEIGGGGIGFVIGAGIGGLVLWAVDEANVSPDAMIIAGGVATALGAIGVTSGVTLAGDLTRGRGNFGHAFLGQAIGSLLALPIVVLGLENDAPELAIVAAGLLPLAGAVLAYEIAHGDQSAQVFVGPSGIAGTIP